MVEFITRGNACLVVLAAATFAWAETDPVALLAASRSKLVPFHAEYITQNKVLGRIDVTPGMKGGWGSFDGSIKVAAAIDARSSRLVCRNLDVTPEMAKNPVLKNVEAGEMVYFNGDDGVYYTTIDDGKRGDFGHHPSGMDNPAAFGYEVMTRPAAMFFGKQPYAVVDANHVTARYGKNSRVTVEFADLGGQEVIAGYLAEDEEYSCQCAVNEWTLFRGMRYPKRISMTIKKGGQPFIERTWTLDRVLESPQPLAMTFREGALIKDSDTNIVYDVRGGKLVPNPLFGKDAGTTTWRRVGFIAATLVVLGWAAWWMKRYLLKGRMKPAAPPAA